MPARHRLTAKSVLLLVLSAATVVHSSTAPHAQSRARAAGAVATPDRAATGKAGEGITPAAADMRAAILDAVHSGRIEDLQQAVELNEIRPVFGNGDRDSSLSAMRKASSDGSGRDVLEALGRILQSEWIAVPLGRDIENNRVYVWPRFAETGVIGLDMDEIAELARIVPVGTLAPMLENGRYDGWRIGIAADGTWHFLRR